MAKTLVLGGFWVSFQHFNAYTIIWLGACGICIPLWRVVRRRQVAYESLFLPRLAHEFVAVKATRPLAAKPEVGKTANGLTARRIICKA